MVQAASLKGLRQLSIIRREEGNNKHTLVIYNYRYSISTDSFGICLVFKDYYPCGVGYLFSYMGKVVAEIVKEGKVLYIDKGGLIHASMHDIKKYSAVLKQHINHSRNEFNREKAELVLLSSLSSYYSISKNQTIIHQLSDTSWSLTESLDYNNIVVITEEIEEENIKSMRSFIKKSNETIGNLNKKIASLEAQLKRVEKENKKIKKHKKQRGRTTLIIASVLLVIIAVFLFLRASGLAVENNELSKELTATKDSLNTAILFAGELYQQNDSLSRVVSNLKSVKFSVGSSKRPSSPSKDRSWVEWIEVKAPLKIESFYTWASSTGGATIIAYDTMHQKVAETRVSVNGGTWQKVNLKNFIFKKVGKYYLCIEDTSIDFAYVSSNDNDYDLYKQGPLQIIGATSRNNANKDNPSIGTDYYQYFFTLHYSLF